VRRLLTNPIYAGAYARGRTKTVTRIKDGRRHLVRGRRVEQQDWDVLITDHHPGYISWEEYQSNQELIAHNANMNGAMVGDRSNAAVRF